MRKKPGVGGGEGSRGTYTGHAKKEWDGAVQVGASVALPLENDAVLEQGHGHKRMHGQGVG